MEDTNEAASVALRISQLDCNELDEYMLTLIQNQFNNCFEFCKYHKINAIKPELNAAIYGYFLYKTLLKNSQSVGQSLLKIRFSDKELWSFSGIQIYHVLRVLMHWWQQRENHEHTNQTMFNAIIKFQKMVQPVVKLFELWNFVNFLKSGEYSTSLFRILGLTMQMEELDLPAQDLSYSIIGRDMLWHGYAEVFFYLATLFNLNQLLLTLRKAMFKRDANLNNDNSINCGICDDVTCQAHTSDCGHLFCYYCLYTASKNGSKCPSCSEAISSNISAYHS